MARFQIGVDIGGTFTDCVVVDSSQNVTVAKAPSTPDDFSRGFFNALQEAARVRGLSLGELLDATTKLAHGTTVGINAVVSRTGARVGLMATKGHQDSLRILNNTGRTNGMPVEVVLNYAESSLPERFVRRRDVAEITERIDCFGEVVVKLDLEQVEREARRLLGQGVETLAVAYLWSHLNPEHEEATVSLLQTLFPSVYISSGACLARRVGEYQRTATAVINSYIGPLMGEYVTRLLDGLADRGYHERLLFAQCDAGLIDAEEVIARPVMTLESGPAAGVVASLLNGGHAGRRNIIATDMGGTTFDVSVVSDGQLPIRDGVVVEQHDLYLRMVDLESVGAGGGSIAWVDQSSGALRVGPRSAGASPGPACYGRGGVEPTVTDADLVLGLLNPANFLGGRMTLDVDAARTAISTLGERLGLSLLECAAGIQTVADSLMEDKIRSMTVSRGHDPRDFVLYAFGGGGGVHAGWFSHGLGISRVIIPIGDLASVWSAYGCSLEGYGRTYHAPMFMRVPLDPEVIGDAFARLEGDAREAASRSGVAWESLAMSRSADLKYALQVFDIEAGVPDGLVDEDCVAQLLTNFEATYEGRFGKGAGYRDGGVDLTALRLTVGPREAQAAEVAVLERASDHAPQPVGSRDVYWPEASGAETTPVYRGEDLGVGAVLQGPALVDFPDTTVVVRPGLTLAYEPGGNLILELS